MKINYNETVAKMQILCDEFIEQNLVDILTQIKMNKVDLGNNFSDIEIRDIAKNTWGVYVFYMRPKKSIATIEDLKGYWETNLSGKEIRYSPQIIANRFMPLKSKESRCLYVGKSEDLAKRIKQHIHQTTADSTYGLKLSRHDRLHSICTFGYSYFAFEEKFDSQSKDGMKCLLVTLEKHLRDELNPLIGKQ